MIYSLGGHLVNKNQNILTMGKSSGSFPVILINVKFLNAKDPVPVVRTRSSRMHCLSSLCDHVDHVEMANPAAIIPSDTIIRTLDARTSPTDGVNDSDETTSTAGGLKTDTDV